uniref:Uncharacterized protein n=1 Tax=Arundo donax TaxID=35708 RepID=A0A0A9ESJ8_ARUDO
MIMAQRVLPVVQNSCRMDLPL